MNEAETRAEHMPNETKNMHERFVSEAITPVVATVDTSRMTAGEPGLPRQFL